MSSHREKLESAIMVACREIAPGMTREEHDWTLHNFRIWRTLSNDNRAMVGALEARAEVRGPEWEKGIKRVVFDRSGFLYHGRIRAVADAARKAGLEF